MTTTTLGNSNNAGPSIPLNIDDHNASTINN